MRHFLIFRGGLYNFNSLSGYPPALFYTAQRFSLLIDLVVKSFVHSLTITNMETTDLIKKIHAEHATWQHRITDIKTELKFLNDELSHFVSKFAPRQVPPHAEHFQNQFIVQKEVLDIMRHDFKQYENLLEANMHHPGKNEIGEILQMHQHHINRMNDFEKLFQDLKAEFKQFASQPVQAL
jgi:hypothetical protein